MESIKLEKKIGTISLQELCSEKYNKYNFIIPTYQRGYRWRTKHVQALINDLASIPEDKTYCLQPIVLQKNKNGNGFLVVDGQQRLTTLMLLLKAWNIKNVWEMAPENPQENQGVINEACRQNTISIANKTVDETKRKIKLDKIFFIWYLLDEKEDGHTAFQRLNSGKIPLTASELIRAKLVGPECANPYEIAAEWERVEQRLRDERFWFMFNGKASESFTRIDKLFEIITHTEEKVKLDRLAPYYAVEKKDKESWWEKLLNLFWMLEQCYNDVELYHYIGWLRHFSGVQFSTLYELYEKNKIDFKQHLQKIIIGRGCDVALGNVGQIAGLLFDKKEPSKTCDELNKYINNNFQYGNGKLKDFFVLFNIESLNAKVRGKDEKSRKRNEYERFPFDLYANLSWDIEHIDSHTGNPMNEPAEQVEWAIETYLENKEKNNDLLDWLKSRDEQKYKDAITKIIEKIAVDDDDKKEKEKTFCFNNQQITVDRFAELYKSRIDVEKCIKDKNQIGNLTLLDHHTNRSYHNAIFPRKRRTIIKTDQTCPGNTFIPPCTRNVFTKYYTNYAVSITQWTQQDADDYCNAIAETFAGLIKAAGYEIKKENEK